ncbi:hypothetical protein HAX54_017983 [Datura stramonium]|uniref:Uncharacterized protein n=1 Tax=Datura stramonium TaxID=4076 RepID=A0ABS8ULI0_DATST|nr:hypothetical protein [Datura stramonium]
MPMGKRQALPFCRQCVRMWDKLGGDRRLSGEMLNSLREPPMGRRIYPVHLGVQNQLATYPFIGASQFKNSRRWYAGGYGLYPAHRLMSAAHRRFTVPHPHLTDGSLVSPGSLLLPI